MIKTSNLRRIYHQFQSVTCSVTLQNKKIYPHQNWHLEQIEISLCSQEKCNNAIVVFTRVHNHKEVLQNLESGAKVIIKMGYDRNEKIVFTGYLHTMEIEAVPNHLQRIELYFQDVRGLMMLNCSFCYLENRKLQDLVQNVIKKKTYQSFFTKTYIDTIDKSLNVPSFMASMSDFDFLEKIANLYGYQFYVDRESLYFVKSEQNKNSSLEMDDAEAIHSFMLTMNLQDTMGKARVVSVNENGERKVAEERVNFTSFPYSKVVGSALKDAIYFKTMNEIAAFSQAQQHAKSLKQKSIHNYAKVSGKSVFLPELNIGEVIQIKNFPDSRVKQVYVQEVKHVFQKKESYSEWEGYLL